MSSSSLSPRPRRRISKSERWIMRRILAEAGVWALWGLLAGAPATLAIDYVWRHGGQALTSPGAAFRVVVAIAFTALCAVPFYNLMKKR